MKIQEYGAYMATTGRQVRGHGQAPSASPGNRIASVSACMRPIICATRAMSTTRRSRRCCKEQRRTKDLEARKQLIFDIQRYAAEQQYYVYTNSNMLTGSWHPYVKNYAPNTSSITAVARPRCGWIGRFAGGCQLLTLLATSCHTHLGDAR